MYVRAYTNLTTHFDFRFTLLLRFDLYRFFGLTRFDQVRSKSSLVEHMVEKGKEHIKRDSLEIDVLLFRVSGLRIKV